MKGCKGLCTAYLIAELVVCSKVAASPADLFGVGTRAQGVAQTGTAFGEHDHQCYTNPALLGGRSFQHLSLGYQSVLFVTRYTAGAQHGEQQLLTYSVLGVTLPVPFGGPLERRLALGLSVTSPRRLVTRAKLWFPERPQFPLLTSQAESLSLTTGVGIKLSDSLSAGVGVRWLASMVGHVLIAGEDDGTTTALVQDELVTSRSPVLGLTSAPLESVRLGLVWRGVQRSDLDIDVQFSDLGALRLPDLALAGTAQYDPEQWEGEVAWLSAPWHLALALRYRRWSSFDGFLRRSVPCPRGETRCGTPEPAVPGFEDTWSPRLGGTWRMPLGRSLRATVRAGLAYEPSPVPEQTGASNYWDNARWLTSLGYGVSASLGGVAFDLDLALQRHWLVERSHQKDSAAAESMPDLARVTTDGSLSLAALELGVTF